MAEERITLRRRGIARRLLGLPPLALGLVVGVGVGLVGGIDLGALAFGIACALLGLYLLGRHDAVILDLSRREVQTVGGVFLPFTRRIGFDALRRVSFRRVRVRSSTHLEDARWPVHVEGDGVRLLAGVEKDFQGARDRAEALALQLGVAVVDRSTGAGAERAGAEIGAALKARLADGGAPTAVEASPERWEAERAAIPEDWEPPGYVPVDPARRAVDGVAPSVSSGDGAVTYRIGPMGVRGPHVRAVVVTSLAIFGVFLLLSCLSPAAVCGGLAFAPLGLLAAWPHREQILGAQTVTLTSDAIEVRAAGRAVRLDLDTLEELYLTDGTGMDGVRTVVGGGAIVAVAPAGRITFGQSLSRAELERLHRELCAWVALSRR